VYTEETYGYCRNSEVNKERKIDKEIKWIKEYWKITVK
jgi:hypothetical protein